MPNPLHAMALAAQIIALNPAPKTVVIQPQPSLKKIAFEIHKDSKETRTYATPRKARERRNVRSRRK